MDIVDEIKTGNACMAIGIIGSIIIMVTYYLAENKII